MATAPKRAKGRSLKDFPNLTAAEKKLLKACREGEIAYFGEERPKKRTAGNSVRASLIRFLTLGGDELNPVHEQGVRLQGASISGDLQLKACICSTPLFLWACDFASPIDLVDCQISSLGFDGSNFGQFFADRIQINGSLFLRNVNSAAGVRLPGARIAGDVCFGGSTIRGLLGDAIIGDGMEVGGNLLFGNGFECQKAIRLVGSHIRGQIDLRDSKIQNQGKIALFADNAVVGGDVILGKKLAIEGSTSLAGAQIGCDLDCSFGTFKSETKFSFRFDGARVAGTFNLSNIQEIVGIADFADMQIGTLHDDPRNWDVPLVLDGMRYLNFNAIHTASVEQRIRWLLLQSSRDLIGNFCPQPWEQVIKVLRDMGHDAEARKVAIAKQEQMRVANKVGDFPLWQLHWLYGFFAGYGHEPLRAVSALLYFWLCGALAFQIADSYGIMGPTSPIINSSEIAHLCGPRKGNLESTWTTCAAMPKEYTTFSAFWYSADLILPLVNLQQEADWAPIVARSELEKDGSLDYIALGVATRLLMWFEILFGWAASLLLVAVLGNLVKKD